jgi:phage RecT family recombinase
METEVTIPKKSPIVAFESTLEKYKGSIINLLGKKYGISPEEFMVKVVNAVKKTPELLNCTPQSLFGSILYFAEIGLPFNTPEGFGYILPYKNKGTTEATPIIGYKGLIEIAYRNPKMKSIRIQAVYSNDEFSYEYGTHEYIKHKPCMVGERGALVGVYAIAKMEGIEPLFVVVHKNELDKIQGLSKSGNSNYSPYNNGTDIFNIMQSKVAIKLLFKTLPKVDNDSLIKVLEMDNKFDYDKNTRIRSTEDGYEIIEEAQKVSALEELDMPEIELSKSERFDELKGRSIDVEQ